MLLFRFPMASFAVLTIWMSSSNSDSSQSASKRFLKASIFLIVSSSVSSLSCFKKSSASCVKVWMASFLINSLSSWACSRVLGPKGGGRGSFQIHWGMWGQVYSNKVWDSEPRLTVLTAVVSSLSTFNFVTSSTSAAFFITCLYFLISLSFLSSFLWHFSQHYFS